MTDLLANDHVHDILLPLMTELEEYKCLFLIIKERLNN